MLRRLAQCTPSYSVQVWNEEWIKTLDLMKSIGRFPPLNHAQVRYKALLDSQLSPKDVINRFLSQDLLVNHLYSKIPDHALVVSADILPRKLTPVSKGKAWWNSGKEVTLDNEEKEMNTQKGSEAQGGLQNGLILSILLEVLSKTLILTTTLQKLQ